MCKKSEEEVKKVIGVGGYEFIIGNGFIYTGGNPNDEITYNAKGVDHRLFIDDKKKKSVKRKKKTPKVKKKNQSIKSLSPLIAMET